MKKFKVTLIIIAFILILFSQPFASGLQKSEYNHKFEGMCYETAGKCAKSIKDLEDYSYLSDNYFNRLTNKVITLNSLGLAILIIAFNLPKPKKEKH